MDNTTLLMDQAAVAAFMGISVTTFKHRRYSDKASRNRLKDYPLSSTGNGKTSASMWTDSAT